MNAIQFAPVAIAVGAFLGATTTNSSGPNRSRLTLSRVESGTVVYRQPSIAYSEYMTDEIGSPAPVPEADDDLLPLHGPSARIAMTPIRNAKSGALEWYFGCYFGIEDEAQYDWDWTYEAHLFDPNNDGLAAHTSWANDKPAFSSSLGRNLTDPISGTYRCTIDWWIESYYLGQRQATVTITNCGDERSLIIKEYKTHNVNWTPACGDFEEYPDQWMVKPEDTHQAWGALKGLLYLKLAWIQEHAFLGNMQITSGYRCPHKNAAISGSAPQSRHMYGDALDMYPPAEYWNPPNEYYFNWVRDAALTSEPGYITEWSTYPSDRHLHVDWR